MLTQEKLDDVGVWLKQSPRKSLMELAFQVCLPCLSAH
jgi:hypothetical protein